MKRVFCIIVFCLSFALYAKIGVCVNSCPDYEVADAIRAYYAIEGYNVIVLPYKDNYRVVIACKDNKESYRVLSEMKRYVKDAWRLNY